jgi:dTDP-4-dehydrorhamnose reductase
MILATAASPSTARSAMRIILILGATGQVGKELLSLAWHYATEVIAPDRSKSVTRRRSVSAANVKKTN